jgi:hypothetical protein
MKESMSRARMLLALAAMTGFAGCSSIGNPVSSSALTSGQTPLASSAAPHDVPFTGKLEGVYTLAFPGPGLLAVTGTGTGNATQLGRYTFEYDEVVDLSTGIGTGTYVFTAANGDNLTSTWTGFGFPTSDPDVLGIVENAIITGGTGRFANAGGSFKVERLFNFTTNSGAGSFQGTIRLR